MPWTPSLERCYNGETFDQAFSRTVVANWRKKGARPFFVDVRSRDYSHTNDILKSREQSRSVLSVEMATYGRRFLSSKKGLMGLAPAAAEETDYICVLFSGQVP